MKVLIISNTVISNVSNMGKTLKAYFRDFVGTDIAQLYIHSQIPTDSEVCEKYYRFTDVDALKSIFFSKSKGRTYTSNDISASDNIHENAGAAEVLYSAGNKRTPLMQLARDIVWRYSRWFSEEMKQWLKEFDPDVIFFASGDVIFMYDIVLKISEFLDIPIVISCYDDFYINNPNGKGWISYFQHRRLMARATSVFKRSMFATTVCESMARDYAKKFNKVCKVIYTGAEQWNDSNTFENMQISYIGNLSLGRYEQIISIGKTLKELNSIPKYVDVYSGENDPKITAQLILENGIVFHGRISSAEVKDVMKNSMAVIHTESFDEYYQDRVRYSVSTKIADSLMNGPCILAYGPKGIASIDYLNSYDAAYVIDSKSKLKDGLVSFMEDEKERERIVNNARKLAFDNHDINNNSKALKSWIEKSLDI